LSVDCSDGVEETVDVGLDEDACDGIGETEDVDVGMGVARRGVTLGVSSRLCLGETDGEDVARGIAVGVEVAVGTAVAVTAVDEDVDLAGAAGVSVAGADSLAGFTNLFGGASAGALASDFILARAFSASW
jgi:hypothetical protein